MRRMLKKIAPTLLVALFSALGALGATPSRLGVDVFNLSVPPETAETVAFSPISFDIDCCVFAAAASPIERAAIAETLGVLTGLHNMYRPIIESLEAAGTNGFRFVSARALILGDIRMARNDFRRRIRDLCDAAVCFDWPRKGAERFLVSKMEGDMEDFALLDEKLQPTRSRYYDLVSVRATPTPAKEDSEDAQGAKEPKAPKVKTFTAPFNRADGSKVDVPYMLFPGDVAYARNSYLMTVRLALEGGANLYLFTPAPNVSFAQMRAKITSESLPNIFASVNSITERGVGREILPIALPVMDFTSKTDLGKGFVQARISDMNFEALDKTIVGREASQYMRFRLAPPENAKSADQPAEGADDITIYNQPFLFIVRHPESGAISVMGQFTGF